jgi:hypothetical protein
MESRPGRRPSSQAIDAGAPKRTLRPWAEVADLFNAQTGDNLTEVQVKMIGLAAINKMAKVLNNKDHKLIRHALQSQLFSR